jgi:hypothetical protein
MNESELVQAYYGAINLAYTTSTWWVTASTALVVATYFAAKHIPTWLIVVILVLYITTAASVLYELHGYNDMATDYGQRLALMRGANKVLGPAAASGGSLLNAVALYAVIVLGSIAAAAFSFVTWRGAREVGSKPIP